MRGPGDEGETFVNVMARAAISLSIRWMNRTMYSCGLKSSILDIQVSLNLLCSLLHRFFA